MQTSDICLAITAQPGSGNLLGNLLCAVAHLLDRGLSLRSILGNLGPANLPLLLNAFRDLLQGALSQLVTAPSLVTAAPDAAGCPVLHLELGPLNLDLLGLVVNLNDCNNGPVTVDITAIPGAGNLLGNLLCSLAGLLDNPQGLLAGLLQGITNFLNGLPL